MDEQKREITSAVAARLKYFRYINGYSQETLALKADLNPAYYGQVERGTKCPTIDTLYKLSKAMDIPLTELLRFDSFPKNDKISVSRLEAIMRNIPFEKHDKVLNVFEAISKLF